MYRLTREGEEYRKNCLPEIQVFHEIKKGLHIGRAKKRLDELKDKKYFAIGFGWAKKNGWIEVKDGEVQITEQGEHALKEKDKITSPVLRWSVPRKSCMSSRRSKWKTLSRRFPCMWTARWQ